MFSSRFSFEQQVSVHGYKWIDSAALGLQANDDELPSQHSIYDPVRRAEMWGAVESSGKAPWPWVIAPWAGDRRDGSHRVVDLDSEEPSLYRMFAKLDASDRDQLLTFANQFGLLGSRINYKVQNQDPSLLASRHKGIHLEPQVSWATHVNFFARSVAIFDWIQAGDVDSLRPNFHWVEQSKNRSFVSQLDRAYVSPQYLSPPTSSSTGWVARGPLYSSSKSWLVASKLLWVFKNSEGSGGNIDPQEQWEHPVDYPNASPSDSLVTVARAELDGIVSQMLDKAATFRLGPVKGSSQRAIKIEPRNLVGLMWLQLARAIADERKYRECKVCHRPFEVLTIHRRTKEYCAPECKLKDYRKRKAQAVDLQSSGSSPVEIAAVTKAPLTTVRKWLNTPKKRKGV